MDPIIGAGLLSLGGSLFGASKASSSHKQSLAQAQQQFDSQMDQSVQRRVTDAKKAGIHPLFALGASVGASPTLSAGGADPGGGILSAGIGKLSAAIMEASGQKKLNEAQAAYYSALAAKAEQAGVARGHDGVQGAIDPVTTGADVVYGPADYVNPEVKKSKSPGVAAGTHPLFVDVKHPNGRTSKALNPDIGLDDISNPSTINILRNMWIDWSSQQMERVLKYFNPPPNFRRELEKMAKAKRKQEKRKPPARNYNPDTDWIAP